MSQQQQYHLKGLKTFNGNEGGGYECNIYLGTKKIARAFNDANGGPDDFHFFDRADEKPFADFTAAWYETSASKPEWEALVKKYGGDADPGVAHKMECWVSTAIDDAENEKRFKRLSKTKTLFMLKGDEKDNWRTLNTPLSAKAVQWIRNKYADRVETIYGESTVQEAAKPAASQPTQATIAPSPFSF